MSTGDVRSHLTELKQLGVRAESVELSGGEPFLYEDHVRQILRIVHEVYGPSGRVQLQTNGFWCTDEEIATENYRSLKDYCVFVVSSVDFYHFEHIDLDRVQRSLSAAADVFGLHDIPHFSSDLADYRESRNVSVSESVEFEGMGFCGNAAFSLAPYVAARPPEDFREELCADVLVDYAKIHIDPYGNVFPPCRCDTGN